MHTYCSLVKVHTVLLVIHHDSHWRLLINAEIVFNVIWFVTRNNFNCQHFPAIGLEFAFIVNSIIHSAWEYVISVGLLNGVYASTQLKTVCNS